MLQFLTSPLILVASTLVPLVITFETLTGSPKMNGPDISGCLLRFWCVHALFKGLPNPVASFLRLLPLANFFELIIWTLLSRELLGYMYLQAVASGDYVPRATDAAKSQDRFWFYRDLRQQNPKQGFAFGQFTVSLLRIVEKWSVSVRLLDVIYYSSLGWIAKLLRTGAPQKPETGASGWIWSYRWFKQGNHVVLEEEYDLMEDVVEDMRKN
ncbi:LAMI_0D10880g1_1 [Lachancea mirantina]|uniref:LAMI_0D10880g1_1 n=1 Tax=Lachancea mirantina TaxID=1230905 RepID=A0A1G4JEP9_9SACH|nr:LAMI_0D10880g1_1 [Lachancea mirantina]